MRIVLTSMQEPLTKAWTKYCGDLPFVEVLHGSIFDSKCKCLVSPSNAFGFMDGGIDWTYSKKFGWDLQARVQAIIKSEYDGELLVGQSFIAKTGDGEFPFMAIAPTMRVPMVLSKRTLNPYLAAKAALRAALNAGISSIAFPGLGTGVGEVSPDMCALQVREAIDEIILGQGMFPAGWPDALERHTFMCTGLNTVYENQNRMPFVE